MVSVPTRARYFETVISICILAVLSLIGLGVFVKQFYVTQGGVDIDAITAELLSEKPADSFFAGQIDLGRLTPSGYEKLLKTEVYGEDILYEKINGKAPFYTESSFEKLSTQRFVSKADDGLWAELYLFDMATIRNAFSVYSRQKRTDAESIALLNCPFGYRTENALYFVSGQYYIELVGSAESDELFEAMTAIAQKIGAGLDFGHTAIAELESFGREALVAGSEKLYLRDAFGFEGLTDTFTAQYKIDGETVTVFFSKRSDKQAAKNLADSYYKFLIDNGAKDKESGWPVDSVRNSTKRKISNGVDNGRVVDFYDLTEIVFSSGQYTAGVHQAENTQAAVKAAVMLNAQLESLDKK